VQLKWPDLEASIVSSLSSEFKLALPRINGLFFN